MTEEQPRPTEIEFQSSPVHLSPSPPSIHISSTPTLSPAGLMSDGLLLSPAIQIDEMHTLDEILNLTEETPSYTGILMLNNSENELNWIGGKVWKERKQKKGKNKVHYNLLNPNMDLPVFGFTCIIYFI